MSIVQQASLVNPQNAHFRDPGMSSKVGAASGCSGSPNSALALQQKGLSEIIKGGKRRGRKSHKRKSHKRKSHKRKSHKENLIKENLIKVVMVMVFLKLKI